MRNFKTAQTAEANDHRVLARTIIQSPGLREMSQMLSDNTDFLHDAQLRRKLAKTNSGKSVP
jgi:hypothetical protein